MTNYTPNSFLKKIEGHTFNSEDELVRYFETIAPAIFEINKSRIVKELRTTSFDGTLSNLADLMILDNFNRTQALVAFEFKLDKSITNYKKGSYEDAENQLHKYCQDLKVPYGVLISDKICEIFKYTFRGSIFNSEKILCLPSLTEIEKELNIDNSNLQKNPVTPIRKLNITQALISTFLIFLLGICLYMYYHPPLAFCELAKGIKGNVSLKQDGTIEDKIYHLPGSKFYNITKLKGTDGDRCFRTDQEALKAGFRKSKAF